MDAPNELTGNWIVDESGRVVGDKAEQEILEALGRFTRLSEREGGWTTLYLDPSDGSYWERTFVQSELHGGGPSKLTRIPAAQVAERYPKLGMA